jgi:adenosylmethionine-8-amino-7-oxononanoate aminotransferase
MSSSTSDKNYVWHPFTPADSWLDPDFHPVMIAGGEASWLIDENGTRYLDGNSSIWTNLHGHRHPVLTQAIKDQLDRIAHSSYLGLAHTPGAHLAEKLNEMAQVPGATPLKYRSFYSDDGSTAMEVALKIVYQYFQQKGQPQRRHYLSLSSGYHGDTVGAMSLGHSPAFHEKFSGLLFPTESAPAPYCYRCPHNQAPPQKADARTYRHCTESCVAEFAHQLKSLGENCAAVVIEPRVQGAAGMIMHPAGYLEKVAALTHQAGALLIVDEVMSGFGRTGTMLACHQENVQPDLIALAKGLSGGYLPFAATLVTETIFEEFRGDVERTFYHGHSYAGNQLGCAAALANLDIFEKEAVLERVAFLSAKLQPLSQRFWEHPQVGDVRQEGLILAVELVQSRETRAPFPPEMRLAWKINERARTYGLLTRGVGSILFLMPPYSTTESELEKMVEALRQALFEILPVA